MQHFASGKRYAAGFPACSRRKTSDESVAVPNESFTLPANVGMAGSFKRTVRIMKLTAVLLTLAFLQVQAKGLGQDVTLNVKEEKLEKVLSLIEKQTGYVFFTTADLLKKARPVTLQVRNEALSRALDLCFKGQALDYVIQGKTISVVERKAIPVSNPISVNTEQIKKVNITGRVINENDEPVAGATVMVKGSTYATATDEKGEFRLEEIEENSTLIITGANIETNEVKIRGRENLSVKVQSKIAVNEAVVVTVNTGYQTFKPNEITGSVTTVNKEQLDQRVATDIISKLEGITNGLVFNKDPLDGTNKLRVRGESTIFANPNPLIVVDNFPYDGDITNINPNDVENITILKDAAAASIWGVQAGNGVIVITTKKAKKNQLLQIELNLNTTILEKPNLFHAPLLSPTQYIDFENILFDNGYYDASLNDANMRSVSAVVEILNNLRNKSLTETDANAQLNALRNIDLRNDLKKFIYQNAVNQQYQVNFSTGSNKASYYFSAGYDRNLAAIKGNSSNRITLNSKAILNPLKNLDLSFGLSYNEGKTFNNGTSSIPNSFPYMRLVNDDGQQLAIPQHREIFEDTISNHGFLDWKYYPLKEREFRNYTTKLFNTRFSGSISYTIIKGLVVEGSYQYQLQTNKSQNVDLPESYFIRNLYNRFAIVDANGNFTGSNFNNQQLSRGIMSLTNSDLAGHYGRINIKFNREWPNHAINLITGLEAREVITTTTANKYFGFDNATGSFITSTNLYGTFNTYPSLTSAFYTTPENGISYTGTNNRFRSYYSNMSYTLKEKYSISASARFDGSNYFGVETNKKTLPLWSLGVKWDISKEDFFNSNQISNLALRITYGYNGNLAQNMAAITTFQYSLMNAEHTGLPYAGINNIPNPNLRWEKSGHLNIGIDFGLLNNRISGSIEYFQKRGDDLIGTAYLDPTTGVTQFTGNFSGMETKGFDAIIQTRNIEKALKWSTTLNLNFSKEKVTRYDVNNGTLSYLESFFSVNPIVGKPLYSINSFKWAGLDPATGNPRFYISDTISQNYSSSLNSKFTMDDLVFSGKYMPPLVGSIQNTFSWRKFSLSFNILFKLGHYFRRSSINYSSMIQQGWQASHSDYQLRWTKPGDENITNVPSFVYPSNSKRDAYYTQSNILIEKADHIRLQFVNFNYTFNPTALKIKAINNLNIFFYANNIGILWRANSKGIDPDFPYLVAPPSRSYSFGIRAGI